MFPNKLINVYTAALTISCLTLASCTKFLDEKPAANLAVIRSLNDMQILLDNFQRMNQSTTGVGEASADNYYLPSSTFNSITESARNIYLWEEDIYAGAVLTQNPWASANNPIYYSNIVLGAIEDVPVAPNQEEQKRYLIGASHFFRARYWHVMAITWAPVYQKALAGNQLGIPLRLSPDFNLITTRASVEDSYRHIIADLEKAIRFLPINTPHVMRPSKSAAYALMSRVYLSMQEYDKCIQYADSSLLLNSYLLDYNELNPTSTRPIDQFNEEVLFHAMGTVLNISTVNALIDSNLYRQYADSDLRKHIFFQDAGGGAVRFKGNYFNGTTMFTGLTVAEVYLNLAESLVRTGRVEEGLAALNTLLLKRWRNGEYEELTGLGQQGALGIILAERRKELVMRDTRWMDLKRLNLEDQWQTTIKRVVDGVEYTLPPNDLRYNIQIPMSVIELSGIQPNPR